MFMLFSAEDQLGGMGPGIYEMAFMTTNLSLRGKGKYFSTHKNIEKPKSVGNFHVCNYSLCYLVTT